MTKQREREHAHDKITSNDVNRFCGIGRLFLKKVERGTQELLDMARRVIVSMRLWVLS
jgi:hypothetical protein